MLFCPLSNYSTTARIIMTEVIAKYYSREIERDWNYTRKVTLAFEIYWRQDAVNINFSTSSWATSSIPLRYNGRSKTVRIVVSRDCQRFRQPFGSLLSHVDPYILKIFDCYIDRMPISCRWNRYLYIDRFANRIFRVDNNTVTKYFYKILNRDIRIIFVFIYFEELSIIIYHINYNINHLSHKYALKYFILSYVYTFLSFKIRCDNL